MNGRKQDFMTALECKKLPEHVPLWELHFHLWKELSGGKFLSGWDFDPLDEKEKAYAISRDADIMVEIADRLGFGGVSIPDSPWPCIYTLPQKWRVELVKELRKRNPDFCVVGSSGGVFTMPDDASIYEEFCYRLFDEPEEIDEMCVNLYNNGFLPNVTDLEAAGIEAIYVAADIADNRSTFLNMEQCERWYLPWLRKCAAYLRERHIYPILHSDGNLNMLLEAIRDSGVCAMQAIDPIARMDIARTQQILAPKVAVCGNLDCGLMLAGTPQEVYDSACSIINACKNQPGFVFGNSNAVVKETPVENYMAMVQAWRDCGRIAPA